MIIHASTFTTIFFKNIVIIMKTSGEFKLIISNKRSHNTFFTKYIIIYIIEFNHFLNNIYSII